MDEGITSASTIDRLSLAIWVLKDFSWVILFFPLTAAAASLAVCLEVHSLLLVWRASSAAIRVHALATVIWLSGNVVWMLSELLFDADAVDKHFPWHVEPSAGANREAYLTARKVARVFFTVGLAMLSVFYLRCLVTSGRQEESEENQVYSANPQDEMDSGEVAPEVQSSEVSQNQSASSRPLAWGIVTPEVYCQVFIGPWMMKDLCWTFEMLAPGLVSSCVALALVFHTYKLYSQTSALIEFNWIVGNTIWMIGELGDYRFSIDYRLISASILFFSWLLAVADFTWGARQPDERVSSETTPLLGVPASSS